MTSLCFTVGHGLDALVRQAYWYENRKKWAMKVLDCLHGITEEQKMSVLEGNARLIPTKDGKRLKLVYRPDEKFKKELRKHQKWRDEGFYLVAGHYVSKSAVDKYADFVVERYRMTLFRPQFFIGEPELVIRMEQIRQYLHDIIVSEADFKGRKGEGYNQFEVAIGKYVELKAKQFEQSFNRGQFGRAGLYSHHAFKWKLKEEFGDWDKFCCGICDKKTFLTGDFRCGRCGRFVCGGCYDDEKDMCKRCVVEELRGE